MTILLIVVILFILIAAAIKFFSISGEKEPKLPYLKKKYFLTAAEREFFNVLERAIENKYYIFPQVHLDKLLFVKKGDQDYIKYLNKINRKSVDFVVVEKNYLNPLLAIELDDSSHGFEKRMKRDAFVERALKDAGIPLLRLKTKRSYGVSEIASFIYNAIHQVK